MNNDKLVTEIHSIKSQKINHDNTVKYHMTKTSLDRYKDTLKKDKKKLLYVQESQKPINLFYFKILQLIKPTNRFYLYFAMYLSTV
jgi:hypothetical protein